MLLWAAVPMFLRAETEARSFPRIITLEEAYDLTLVSDQSIGIALLEIRKANLLPWSAVTRLGLSATGNGSYNQSRTTFTNGGNVTRTSTGLLEISPRTTRAELRGASFSLQQPLLDLTVFPAYRLGKLTAHSARLEYRFTIRETLFGVAQAYYAVLKDQSIVAINRQTVDLAGSSWTWLKSATMPARRRGSMSRAPGQRSRMRARC